MKKIIVFIIVLILLLSALSGCANSVVNPPDGNQNTDNDKNLTALGVPENLFVWANGEYAIWNSVENASGYILKVKDTEVEFSGSPANVSQYTKYAGVYEFYVKAKGDNKTYKDSEWSKKAELIIPPSNDRLRISSNTVWGYDGVSLTTEERNASELILLNTLDTTIATCTAIGQNAFEEENITLIYITAPIETIGVKAFYKCAKLTSVQLPETVSVISDLAFYGADGLNSVTINSQNPPSLGSRAFPENEGLKFYVPAASVEAYKTAWSAFSDRIFAA